MLSFFPRDVLDEILYLIESVSEDFPTYSSTPSRKQPCHIILKPIHKCKICGPDSLSSCISELLYLYCVDILKNLPIHSFKLSYYTSPQGLFTQ